MTKRELTERLARIENELSEIRDFLSKENPIEASSSNNQTRERYLPYTLDDLYKEFGSKKGLARRLKSALDKRGITTLQEFLSLSPGQLFELENVGSGTLERTKTALDRLGIKW